jgi:hypothetical protein
MEQDKYQAMYELYQSGKTLDEVGEAFGITGAGVQVAFKRRGWQTRGNDAPRRPKPSKVVEFDDSALVEFKKMWDGLDSKLKGTIIEGNVKNKLAELGFDVWIPYMNNHKADLGLLIDGRLIKLQVKSATYDPTTKRFRSMLQTRDRDGNHIKYKSADVDFFIVQCAGLQEFYIIPTAIGIENHSVNLIPHRNFFIQHSGPDWEVYRNAFDLLK